MKKSKPTQNKNPDLEGFQNSQIQSRKTRYFSLMTYASEKQIQKVIQSHIKSIRAFAFIFHDKDEAEPHHHIIMRTHSTWSSFQIRKWFAGLLDKEKKQINTFCEPANDLGALEEYLTHSDEESKQKGKHEYSRDDIKDFGLWDMIPRGESYDDSYEILNHLLSGTSYREMVRHYGRKFVYHWGAYSDLADKIRTDEGYKEAAVRSRFELIGEPNYKVIDSMEDLEK